MQSFQPNADPDALQVQDFGYDRCKEMSRLRFTRSLGMSFVIQYDRKWTVLNVIRWCEGAENHAPLDAQEWIRDVDTLCEVSFS